MGSANNIVPVAKPNGTVRICGDYKLTVNQVSKANNRGKGGNFGYTGRWWLIYPKLISRWPWMRKFTTINTHEGLFQYNRLPFGVSLVPRIFQRTMDDILVSKKDDNNHFANLEAALKRLSEAGLLLWKEKCFFMVPEVTYCGYVINGSDINTVEATFVRWKR